MSIQGFCWQQRASHLPVVTSTHVCKHCQIGGQKSPPVGTHCFQRYSMHKQPEVCVPLLGFLPILVAHRVPVQLTGGCVQGAGPGLRRGRRSLTRSRMSWSTSCSPPPAPSRAGGERERLAASCLSVRVTRAAGGRPAPSRRPWASARYPEACSPRPGTTSGLRGRRSAASGRRRFRTAWACASSSCQHRRNSSRLGLFIAAAPGLPRPLRPCRLPRDSPSAGSVPLAGNWRRHDTWVPVGGPAPGVPRTLSPALVVLCPEPAPSLSALLPVAFGKRRFCSKRYFFIQRTCVGQLLHARRWEGRL